MPLILGFPELAATYPGPALFVSGANSPYVRPGNWTRITELFPAARQDVLAKFRGGAERALPAERARELEDLLFVRESASARAYAEALAPARS